MPAAVALLQSLSRLLTWMVPARSLLNQKVNPSPKGGQPATMTLLRQIIIGFDDEGGNTGTAWVLAHVK